MVLALLVALATSTLTLPLDAWAVDPAFSMSDAYKWIFQATLGGEHAAPSRDMADQWLRQEWQQLGPTAPDEPLTERLGDTGIVRLHLRPFRDAGGAPEALLDAFLASAVAFRADHDVFVRAWRAFGDRLRQAPAAHLTRDAWVQLDEELRGKGYPAVHHSDEFTRAHRPAYRVVTAKQAWILANALGAGSGLPR